MDQTKQSSCAGEAEAGGGWRALTALESRSFGGERRKMFPTHAWGSGREEVPAASAFSGWLTCSQNHFCLWLWQTQPLLAGAGVLQPSRISHVHKWEEGRGQAGALPIVPVKKSEAPRSQLPPEVTQLVSEPGALNVPAVLLARP